ncbi:fimbrial protein [uncultured Pantoea sp.]|uniref:fimbrial protein n=1 Tax=uncultured Pantoea sp. TaxID=218084 RepID=UPI0025F7E606|nr:fimbrial protein [uncultured Pantoea sp.]
MDARLHTLLTKYISVIAIIFFVIPFCFAVQTGDTLDLKIHGTLKRKPCHINNDGMIYIEFGNVGIKKIDGKRYIQDINYTLECEDPDDSANLKMTVKGAQTSYNTGAINTNIPGLGIGILQNGLPVIINQPFVIDYNSPPVLKAVPVASGVTLYEGAFNATATLLAEYE